MLNIEPLAAFSDNYTWLLFDEATRERGEPTAPSDIALELATNPFLRCNDNGLQLSLRRQGKHPGARTAEVFAAVRAGRTHSKHLIVWSRARPYETKNGLIVHNEK